MNNNSRQFIENIFAHAVALDQRGFKNIIYTSGKHIYILGFDNTVLLQFELGKSETSFKSNLVFNANDYESGNFYEEDGKIVFETKTENFIRKKSCGVPKNNIEDVGVLFNKYWKTSDYYFELSRDILSLLDESLSHIEISIENGELIIKQRNIYSGSVIEITTANSGSNKTKSLLGVSSTFKLPKTFGPIGMRTKDFMALYTFQNNIKFSLSDNYILVNSVASRYNMKGIVSLCLYDEIIEIQQTMEE